MNGTQHPARQAPVLLSTSSGESVNFFRPIAAVAHVVLWIGCAGAADSPQTRETLLSQRDRAVYHEVLSDDSLNQYVLPKPGDTGPTIVGDYLVVVANTDISPVPLSLIVEDTGELRNSISESFPQLSRECLDNFVGENRESSAVLPQLTAKLPVVMLDQAGFSAVKAEGKLWANFWTMYPDAIALVHLSVIGYDASGSQALVYLHGRRGSLSGRSHLVFLIKEEEEWSIAATRQVLVN